MQSFKTFLDEHIIQEAVEYHKENSIPLDECLFRYGSEKYFQYFSELKEMNAFNLLPEELITEDLLELLESDIGEFDLYEGETVPLDFIMEDETPELNKPKRGGSAKYIVYVKNPQTGNIKKIQFGDTTGLTAKYNNPERKKAFAARHNCSSANDKLSRSYWACRINKYLGKTPAARSGYW